jgi:hypothetical protein
MRCCAKTGKDAEATRPFTRATRIRPPFRNVLLACDLTLGVLGWPAIEVGGHGAGWAGQAAFAVVGGLLLGFLAGFLTAG